uniref:Putative reverse transcriptase domain-containing protein n=1 Tax=Tanacetum cinerariifolium TaxID=118510 RepID=A0A6L2JTM6_TANCI|nr:putative reverse transcriptase domain-containing protein [Tanacetum cinerariifolium]
MVKKQIAEAIEEYERTRVDLGNASGSGEAITGEVGLRRWIEKVEQVFEICKCAEEDKVMFAASTFKGRALTWWNGNVHTLGLVNASRIPWTEFKSMMTTEYFPAIEIQRMEQELWTLTLKGDDIEAYNNRFHELALMCLDLVPNEKKKIKRYMKGFPEKIKGNITSARPTTLHEAVNLARELVEQAVQGKAARASETPAKGKTYAGNLSKCNWCNLHHIGHYPPKYRSCQKLGHIEADCRTRLPGTDENPIQNVTYYRCGEKGYLRHQCPKGRNQRNEGARGRAYVVVENPQQNPNVVTDMFLLNDHYASVLFDSGAERSFVSIEFTPYINISPVALNTSYDVELADGKIVSTNIVLHGCTLALFSHMFKIDLLATRLGSFDVIVGMDWLSYYRAIIVCYEKIVRIPLSNGEILEIHGLPSVREIEFCIDLIPGALPVVRSPYRLAPFEMQELSNQLKELQEKGFIRPSHSPWGAPVLFVKKKDATGCMPFLQDRSSFRISPIKVLALLDGPNDFVVYCDASNQGFGCVLMQRGKRCLVELLSDYECEIKYHPSKANVVADALSRKERLKPRRVHTMSMTIQSGLKAKILEAQGEASKDLKALAEWLRGLERHFEKRDDGGVYFFDRVWIPLVGGIRKLIMDEAHTSRYSVHLGADKMYYDLRDLYCWPGMKRDIAEYVSKCLTCSKIKAERQKPSGLLQQPEILEWKSEKITMDLVTKLPKSSSGHDAIWVVVDRLTKSAHFIPIREDYKIEKLARIYINEIALGTKLNMSTTYHAETDGQSERTIQTLEDMLRAYVMDFGGSWDTHLPLVEFSYNNSYHKSIKCAPFEALYEHAQIPLEEIKVDENLRFVKEPIEIVERDVKKLKRRRIPLVKVRWNSRQGAEYTWEREDQFKTKYPYLFTSTSSAVFDGHPIPPDEGDTAILPECDESDLVVVFGNWVYGRNFSLGSSRNFHDDLVMCLRVLMIADVKMKSLDALEDSMIPNGQKNTLVEYMILSGADNRPPMLDKDLYDSWKSRMELYMKNREHGRMILELVGHGPLTWPTIEENGVTRTKNMLNYLLQRKSKLIMISKQLISFFKFYHLISTHSLIITELPRIYGKKFNLVTVQPLHMRQNSYAAGTPGTIGNYSAQGKGKVLNEEELEFLPDLGIVEAKAVLMANLSSYSSDVLSEVNEDNLIANETLSAELKRYKEQVKLLEERQNVDLGYCLCNHEISQQFQLAYDVHKCRMIPQLVIILEEEMCTSENIVTNSRVTPSLREIVILTILVKLASYTLRAELQAKDMTIQKLKEHIKRVNETSTSESVKKDFDEIETINIELEHREKVFVITTLKNDLRKLKGKEIADNAAQVPNATTIAPGMYKLHPVTVAPRDKNNRETHIY